MGILGKTGINCDINWVPLSAEIVKLRSNVIQKEAANRVVETANRVKCFSQSTEKRKAQFETNQINAHEQNCSYHILVLWNFYTQMT